MSPADGPKKISGAKNVNRSGFLSLRGDHTILNILMIKDFCHVTVDITVAEWSLQVHSRKPTIDVLVDVQPLEQLNVLPCDRETIHHLPFNR